MISLPASSARRSKTAAIAASDSTAAVVCLIAIVAPAKPAFESVYHLLGRFAERLEVDFGVQRRLIGRIEPGEVLDRTAQRALVEALRVAPGAFLERRVDEHLDELALAHDRAGEVALGAKRRDERYDHDQPGIRHQPRHLGDAADVLNPVGLGEAEIAVQAVPHI